MERWQAHRCRNGLGARPGRPGKQKKDMRKATRSHCLNSKSRRSNRAGRNRRRRDEEKDKQLHAVGAQHRRSIASRRLIISESDHSVFRTQPAGALTHTSKYKYRVPHRNASGYDEYLSTTRLINIPLPRPSMDDDARYRCSLCHFHQLASDNQSSATHAVKK